jgi:hydrid cluster protein-associated redox disulfide domain
MKMAKISKDMLINDILEVDAGNAAILMAAGMHCIGCMAAAGESLEEAAAVHGLNAEELEQEINEYLAKKEQSANA